jgi:hypothetical protein
MPKSKGRPKPSNKKRRRPRPPEPDFQDVNGSLRMSKAKFESLRNDPDFITAIQLGRVLNAIAYALELQENRPPVGSKTSDRYALRTLFIMASYVHEALELLTSLRIRYATNPAFEPVKSLLEHPNKRRTKILKLIRDRVGFHLDDDKVATPAAMAKLNLPYYDIVSSESAKITDFFFNISDNVDLNYLLDELKGDEGEAETLMEILNTVSEMLLEVALAAHPFLTALVNNL